MIGDRCTAIRLALAFMYNPPPEPSHTTTRQIAAESDPPALTLDRVPAAARELEFAHKYGMLELQIAQEAFLVEPLQHEFDYCNGDRPTVDQVIDYAVAAENFNLGALLTICESVILGDHIQTDLYKETMGRLPPASLLRIARYCHSHHTYTTDQMCTAVFRDYLREHPAGQEGSATIVRCLLEKGTRTSKLRHMQKSLTSNL